MRHGRSVTLRSRRCCYCVRDAVQTATPPSKLQQWSNCVAISKAKLPFSHKFAGNPMQIFCYKRTTFFLLLRILHHVTFFFAVLTFFFFAVFTASPSSSSQCSLRHLLLRSLHC